MLKVVAELILTYPPVIRLLCEKTYLEIIERRSRPFSLVLYRGFFRGLLMGLDMYARCLESRIRSINKPARIKRF